MIAFASLTKTRKSPTGRCAPKQMQTLDCFGGPGGESAPKPSPFSHSHIVTQFVGVLQPSTRWPLSYLLCANCLCREIVLRWDFARDARNVSEWKRGAQCLSVIFGRVFRGRMLSDAKKAKHHHSARSSTADRQNPEKLTHDRARPPHAGSQVIAPLDANAPRVRAVRELCQSFSSASRVPRSARSSAP